MHERQVTIFAWYVLLIWALAQLVSGAGLQPGFFKPASNVVSAAVVLAFVFDRWMWRWIVFRGWLVKRPDLQGTWRVELQSNWTLPESQARIAPIEGFLVVRQTYSRLSMRLLTAESTSRLRGAEITCDADELYEVAGVYSNEPKVGVRDRSPIHNGAISLAVRGTPPTALEGHYWTDRGTRGELTATSRVAKLFATFQDAKAALSPPSPTGMAAAS